MREAAEALDDLGVPARVVLEVGYSGITLRALGFPTSMFTVLFALARTVGWISQWKEMIEDPDQRIGRPRQLYTGPAQRDYVAVDKR